jgi:hypothetical protein
MNTYFTIGAVVGWLLVSLLHGTLLPALSIATWIAVAVGGTIGQIVGPLLAGEHTPGQDRR